MGTTTAIPGNIEVAMIAASVVPLPRKSSGASAYAAVMPMTSVMIVVLPATIRLLSRPRANPLLGENAAFRLSREAGIGSSELENWSEGRRNAETTIQ